MTTLERDKKYLIQCYTTDDLVFTKGKGMYLYDEAGRKYLDFSGQFSACTLGHGNEEMIEALKVFGLKEKYDVIRNVRGRGLLQGMEIEGTVKAAHMRWAGNSTRPCWETA